MRPTHSLLSAFVASGTHTAKPKSLSDITLNFRRTEAKALKAEEERNKKGFFSLPQLLYSPDRGISPLMSAKQLLFIRNVYHKDAVDTLNRYSVGSSYEGHPLDVVIQTTSFDAANSVLHTAACEHFNHSFFFRSVAPFGTPMPQSVANAIHLAFSTRGTSADRSTDTEAVDLDSPFEKQVLHAALNHQAKSGWLYLLRTPNGLKLRTYSHGTCPLSGDSIPLLCLNLHDHAFCLDYKGEGAMERYTQNWVRAINWNLPQRYLGLADGAKTLDLLAYPQ